MPAARRLLAIALLLLLAGCTGEGERQERPTSPPAGATTLSQGVFRLAAASSFDDPGFHAVVAVSGPVRREVAARGKQRLVLTLRDPGRPEEACTSEHPLSGCATVDWSDAEDRPHVPPGGVFDNRLTIGLASGARKFYLRESGALATSPGTFEPG